jgi:hypothetical protein
MTPQQVAQVQASFEKVAPITAAHERVIQSFTSRSYALSSSFPRKREPRAFNRLPLGPRFRGGDEFVCSQDFLTSSEAGGSP